MKAIISHDIDHITAWEHRKDLIIPKFLMRSFIECITGYVGIFELSKRCYGVIKNQWQNIEPLIAFNIENKIPATFFIAVNNGLGLAYTLKNAGNWIKEIKRKGFDIGVHGISFDNYFDIRKEYEIFKTLSGLKHFGIRMHYLRNSVQTLNFLTDTGYQYDSTIFKLQNPFKLSSLWEFPLHIMDGAIMHKNCRWDNQKIEQAIEETKIIITEAVNNQIKYLTILFHDRYFSDTFKTRKAWYIWLISFLEENNIELISYKNAIKELESAC